MCYGFVRLGNSFSVKGELCRLLQVWGDHALSDSTVLNGFHEYQHGNLNVEDGTRSDHPRIAVRGQIINAVQSVVEADPHTTYEQIDDVLGISFPKIFNYLWLFETTKGLHSVGASPAIC